MKFLTAKDFIRKSLNLKARIVEPALASKLMGTSPNENPQVEKLAMTIKLKITDRHLNLTLSMTQKKNQTTAAMCLVFEFDRKAVMQIQTETACKIHFQPHMRKSKPFKNYELSRNSERTVTQQHNASD